MVLAEASILIGHTCYIQKLFKIQIHAEKMICIISITDIVLDINVASDKRQFPILGGMLMPNNLFWYCLFSIKVRS